MKKINFEKFMFLTPYFMYLVLFCFFYNNNFDINGGKYELFISEFLFLSIVLGFVLFLVFIIFRKFVKNDYLLILLQIVTLISINNHFFRFFLLLFLVFIIFYKNDNEYFNLFFKLTIYMFFSMSFLLFIYNGSIMIYNVLSVSNRKKNIEYNFIVNIDESKKSPNIYWFHMDGMPNISFIENRYNRRIDNFLSFMDNNEFIVNKEASFKGGHHTLMALNALFNPNYYDKFFKSYLDEYDKCILDNCKTKDVVDFKEVTYKKLNNEFFKAFKKKGYKIVGITEYNQYTSLNSDFVYDIGNYLLFNNKMTFFENKYDVDEVYNEILRIHTNNVVSVLFGINNFDNKFNKDYMDINWNSDDYPLISNTKFLPVRASIQAMDNVKSIDDNPKLYFIDNSIMHLHWNYDENGNFIRDNNGNLNDFDDCYIYTTKLLMEYIKYINETDPGSVIIIQGDHGIHDLPTNYLKSYFNINEKEVLNIRNSTISAIYVPIEYRNGEEEILSNPLNITRYLVNNFVGDNYKYINK